MNTEIGPFVNVEVIKRSRYYFATLNIVVAFLATHQLAFRGKIDSLKTKTMNSFPDCVVILLKKCPVFV